MSLSKIEWTSVVQGVHSLAQRGALLFHYAPPPCELACKGGKLSDASAEDLKAGIHVKGKCPKCDVRVAYR